MALSKCLCREETAEEELLHMTGAVMGYTKMVCCGEVASEKDAAMVASEILRCVRPLGESGHHRICNGRIS